MSGVYGLKGRTALVTGAAKRIGREIALALAADGVNVVVHYNSSSEEADEAASSIGKKGVKAWTIKADFGSGGYEGLIDETLKLSGGLDILVNSASIFPSNRLKDATFDGFAMNMRVNAWAPFVLSRDFARLLGRGKIINMLDSRLSGFEWTHVEYIWSKHVLASMTRMMAVDYAPDITVNGVSPGLILPPPGKGPEFLERMDSTVPLKRHGSPADIASAVLYLLKSEFLTGEVINVDGGRHLIEYGGRQDPH